MLSVFFKPQKSRAKVPRAQSWLLSMANSMKSAKAVVWWQYERFPKPLEKQREIPPYRVPAVLPCDHWQCLPLLFSR